VMGESFSTEANQSATKTVIEAVVADHGGTNKCPWSTAELRGAAATYFKSLNDAAIRAKRGKKEDHKRLCRKQGRMRDRRLSSIIAQPWSEEKKTLVKLVVGSMEYTSSDESNFSEDENEGMQLSGYLVKRLPWERSALAKVKKALDEKYRRQLTPRARVNFLPRREHAQLSTRKRPINRHDWAVRPETGRIEQTPSINTLASPSVSTALMLTVSPHNARSEPTSVSTPSPTTVRPQHTILSCPASSSSTQPLVTPITTPSPRSRSPNHIAIFSSTLTPRNTSTTRVASKKSKKAKRTSCRRPLQEVSPEF